MNDKKTALQQVSSPTKSEMEVLQILWRTGPSTVRFVHDRLNAAKEIHEVVGYTSTLKLMQMMKEKGLLERNESQMKHIYSAVDEKKVKGSLLNRFLDSIYGGSPSELLVALLGNEKASQQELKKMKELFIKLEEKE